jgi:osmotically-inducible protein OsmY
MAGEGDRRHRGKSDKGIKDLDNDIGIVYESERADGEIQGEVQEVLRWGVGVDGSLIDVGVEDGKVSLTGTVGSAIEKSRAEVDA